MSLLEEMAVAQLMHYSRDLQDKDQEVVCLPGSKADLIYTFKELRRRDCPTYIMRLYIHTLLECFGVIPICYAKRTEFIHKDVFMSAYKLLHQDCYSTSALIPVAQLYMQVPTVIPESLPVSDEKWLRQMFEVDVRLACIALTSQFLVTPRRGYLNILADELTKRQLVVQSLWVDITNVEELSDNFILNIHKESE